MQKDLVQHRSRILSNFVCQHTGNCCISPGYVYVSANDIEAMATELQIPISQFIEHFVIQKNGWSLIASPTFRTRCFLNESNQCQVYATRPSACRTYPDWDDIWANNTTVLKESRQCQGLALAIQKSGL